MKGGLGSTLCFIWMDLVYYVVFTGTIKLILMATVGLKIIKDNI